MRDHTRPFTSFIVLTTVLAALCPGVHAQAPTPAPAPEPPAAAPAPGIELSGLVDLYYGYDFNRPSSRRVQARAFDVQLSSISLSLAELALEKKPAPASPVGFRVDLDFGPVAATMHATEPGGATVFQNIGQAYLSYLAPAGNGLQIDVGEFATPIGYEVIKAKDNWNYSRSLLFTLAEPYYHMGVRAAYSFNDRFTLAAHVVNGWNDVVDNNAGKTVGLQATMKPIPAVTITQTYMGGPEQPDNDSDWRHLFDTIVSYTATPRVSVAANYDYGRDTVAGADVRWQGIAGYVRVQPTDWFALTPRLEYYDDPQGFTSGTSQTLREVTLTGELKNKHGLVLRLEYRHDASSVPFFERSGSSSARKQDTLTIGLMYAFSSGGK